jgi:hypothetical protein
LDKRRGGMRALGAALTPITTPILGKEGIGAAQLLTEWPAIVGAQLAGACWPVKLTFPRGERREGTLRLRVAAALAPEIQHREPILLERINGYFGYRAVARLAIVQGPPPLPDVPAPPVLRPLAASERRTLDARLDDVTDPELRAALDRLGTAIIGRQ